MSEQARITFTNLVGIGAVEGEEKEAYEKRFKQFLKAWVAESGIEGAETFVPDAFKPTFDVATVSMTYDFRDRVLRMCEFIQKNRGHRMIEGNADLLWSITTDDLSRQIHLNVLNGEMLRLFSKKLKLNLRLLFLLLLLLFLLP